MTMTADAASMPPPDTDPSRWTAAEFLSSYRYWSLVLASIFAGLAVGTFNAASLPQLGRALNSIKELSYVMAWIAIARFLGIFFGCGAGIAVGVTGRGTRAALVIFIVLSCATAAAFLILPSDPQLYPILLTVWRFFSALLTTALLVAAATMLVGGRPSAPDFAVSFGLLILLSAAIATIIPQLIVGLSMADDVFLPLVVFLVLALLSLLPIRRLRFDAKPRRFHRPRALCQRSPSIVTFLALLGPLAIFLFYVLIFAIEMSDGELGPWDVVPALALLVVVALFVTAYIGVWCYRIHSELTSVESPNSLLTPLAALLIALFVPFGLPVILIMLWLVLDERARRLTKAPVSRWAIFWSVFFPAIGMGMIQSAVNQTTRAA